MPGSERLNRDIAIIGLAGRFPGARDVREFWQNLYTGRESLSFFSEEELAAEGIDRELVRNPAYVRAKGVVEECDRFDAPFFRFSPREAELTDPQHRVFLECAWHALEDAGHVPETCGGRIGVFAGSNLNTYLLWNLHSTLPADCSELPFDVRIGNDKDYLTTRVSYKLSLKGPSVAVQTACSTSLVAVHTACQSLLRGDCDLALAGAVSITFPVKRGYLYSKEGMFPPDGHCRPFNAFSEGCPDSDGVGVVVLRTLEAALAGGDHIYAIIKGSAINNDGSLKVGFTAPSVARQAAVVEEALKSSGVDPETIAYIETHGSATPLGDSIEIEALTEAFRGRTQKTGFCAVGSVKSNIGHTNVASGMAGLIKTVLSFQGQAIPATLHFEKPNPYIDFEHSPFRVAHRLTPWPRSEEPRRACVSSFGIGGTNAHVVLEEPMPMARSPRRRETWQLLTLSGRTSAALDTMTGNLAEYLRQNPEVSVVDVAHTLRVGRRALNERRIVLGRTAGDLASALETKDPRWALSGQAKQSDRPVVFMFPGLGDHYLRMGLEIYETEPVFRRHVDYCAEFLQGILNVDLRTVLYPAKAGASGDDKESQEPPSSGLNSFKAMIGRNAAPADPLETALNKTTLAHSALFVVEYALARLWMEWGIRPKAMIGYSIGEYVAACLAGVVALDDALTLVARRAEMIESLPKGAMLAITLPAAEAEKLLPEDVFLSALNGSGLSVVSGGLPAIARLERELKDRNIVCRRLSADYPFHSKLMEPIAAPFTAMLARVALNPPRIPFLSNVTGTWITADLAVDPAYWGRHLSEKVRFVDGIAVLMKERKRVFLEVGPGNTLSSIALQHLTETDQERLVLASLGHRYDEQGDIPYLLRTVGKLWINGVEIDWKSFQGWEEGRRVSLPGYPFERERYMVDLPRRNGSGAAHPNLSASDPLLKRPAIADWFYAPSWKLAPSLESWSEAAAASAAAPSNWLIFADDEGIGAKLTEKLESLKQKVAVVRAGSGWAQKGSSHFAIDPGNPRHYGDVLHRLSITDSFPETIAHLWSVSESVSAPTQGPLTAAVQRAQMLGFNSVALLAQALAGFEGKALHLGVVSSEVHAVTGEESVHPEKATILGACKVIPQELPNVTCANIDLAVPKRDGLRTARFIESLIVELRNHAGGVTAFRGGRRWVRTMEPLPLPSVKEPHGFRRGGTYLITGGMGAIGLTLAEHLARSTGRVNLVLVGRSELPDREHWQSLPARYRENEAVRGKIRRLQALERIGAEIMIAGADVCDPVAMGAIVHQARNRFGRINGVIHAAGVGGGGLLQLRSQEMSEAIIRPKLMGSLALDSVLAGDELDFFVVCSSISSFIGGLGQADHAAANAFLDSFADWRSRARSSPTVAINWDSWQMDGLAFKAIHGETAGKRTPEDATQKIDGPIFHQYQIEASGRFVFSAVLNTSRQWLLGEHRILDRALVPGTGYLEMVRQCAGYIGETGELEIRDLVFIFPLFVADGADALLRLVFEKTGDSFKFTFLSRAASAPAGDSQWLLHAEGTFLMLKAEPPPRHDIRAFLAQTDPDRTKGGELPTSGPLLFGPHWQNLEAVYPGRGQSMAQLKLPEEFCDELRTFCLHPALMDIATSFVIQGRGFYMPITYTRLRFRAPLTPKIYSLLVCPEESYADSDVVTFNLRMTDMEGKELVAIDDFVMKRISDASQRLPGWTEPAGAATVSSEAPGQVSALSFSDNENPFHRHLTQGILPGEGAEIFDRVLSRPDLTQIVVSTVDFNAWSGAVDAYTTQRFSSAPAAQTAEGKQDGLGKHRRPNLGIPYVAPRDSLETALAQAVQDLLGIRSIGIDDSFFDLGGDSLKGVKFVGRLRHELSLNLSLKELYALPTVRAIAESQKPEMQQTAV